jgi:hypothetical protein
MTAVATEVSCPKCGGKTWDNRETKTNPKAPDYKCKDRACDGVIWPPKNGAAPKAAAAPRPAATAKAPMALGATMPWEEDETTADVRSATVVVAKAAPARSDLTTEFALYSRCLDQARAEFLRTQLDQMGGDVAGAIVAAAATLYIQAHR